MKLRVNVNMDNAAFEGMNERAELKRILYRLAEDVSDTDIGGDLRDINGNMVGNWTISGGSVAY